MTFELSKEQLKQMISESADLYISNVDWKNLTDDDFCENCWRYFCKYMEYFKIKKYIANFYVTCYDEGKNYEGKKKFVLSVYFNFFSLGETYNVLIKFIKE